MRPDDGRVPARNALLLADFALLRQRPDLFDCLWPHLLALPLAPQFRLWAVELTDSAKPHRIYSDLGFFWPLERVRN